MARNGRTPPCPTPTPAPTIAQCHSIPAIRIERTKDESAMADEIVSAPKPTPPPRSVTYGNSLAAPTTSIAPRQQRQTSTRSHDNDMKRSASVPKLLMRRNYNYNYNICSVPGIVVLKGNINEGEKSSG
uniref:Uncharacterized protein n=1 Tax=Caenorhabditis japonica TaxID=281687 RepID=A0A8R1I4L2_CAEJA